MERQKRENYLSRFNGLNLSEDQLERQWRARLEEEESLRIAEAINMRLMNQQSNAQYAASGGTAGESLPSDSIEYVVDTTTSNNADFEVTVSADTNVTVNWGDGQIEEMLVTNGDSPVEFDHRYDESGEGIIYTIRVTFDNIENVTELEFFS